MKINQSEQIRVRGEEIARLYKGIRRLNPQIRAIHALDQARVWVQSGSSQIQFYES